MFFFILGIVIISIAVFAVIVAFGQDTQEITFLVCIGIAFVELLLLAFGELIKLFLQIEENTRK